MSTQKATGKFLSAYLSRQLSHFFPDRARIPQKLLNDAVKEALIWLSESFSQLDRAYYEGGLERCFNHLNGDHYAMFLYCVSRKVHELEEDSPLAAKTFLLNKCLHGLDVFYKVRLPRAFLFVHPIGTVLGNASYGDFFCVYQNCTVGSKHDGTYPTFGKNVTLYSGASAIGDCEIGDDVIFAANSSIVSKPVPPRTVVLGRHPDNRFLTARNRPADRIFRPSEAP
ncbi:serine acetyltransferase [Elusimicrobiota bacterium]